MNAKAKTAADRNGAPIRTAEVRQEPVREPVRKQRRLKNVASTSPTEIPREMIPDGVDLQWVTDTIHGAPETQMRLSYEMNAWEPVTPDMFDGRFDGRWTPRGHKGEIIVYGQVLMWRPMELTLEARAEEQRDALGALVAQENKLRAGQIDGVAFDTQHPTARKVTSVTRGESMPIID